MAAINNDETKVITGKVRLSYAHLFEPFSNNPQQDPKYSCVVLVPKSDKATIKKLRRAQQAALENGKSRVFGGKIPKTWHDTIRDGDEDADLEVNPEYEGCLFFSVSSKTRPGLVDRNVEPIVDQEELYSGVFARVSIRAFAYNTQGNRGVSFGLNHVQKVADGQHMGGRTSAESDFEPLDDDEYDDYEEDEDGIL